MTVRHQSHELLARDPVRGTLISSAGDRYGSAFVGRLKREWSQILRVASRPRMPDREGSCEGAAAVALRPPSPSCAPTIWTGVGAVRAGQ